MILSAPQGLTIGLELSLDPTVLLFTAAAAAVSALLFALGAGVACDAGVARGALEVGPTRSATGSRGRQRVRAVLVVAETALAMMLLVGAGLLIRSLSHLQDVTPGFNPTGVVMGGVSLPERQYAKPEQREPAFYEARARSVAAGPLRRGSLGGPRRFRLPGATRRRRLRSRASRPPPTSRGRTGAVRTVTAGYFDTLAIPVHQGTRIHFADDRARHQLGGGHRRPPGAHATGRTRTRLASQSAAAAPAVRGRPSSASWAMS